MKILALAALAFSGTVFAQSYPSPTFTSVTLQTALAESSGGTGSGSPSGTALDNITGFSGTGFLIRTGVGAYAFQSSTNGITLSNLTQIAANTVLVNSAGSTSNVAAFTMPSCSASTSALQWASGTGFTCYANSATTTGTLAQFSATTSAQLAGIISDETGSGAAVFGTSPAISAAALSTPTISGGTVNNASIGGVTPNSGAFTSLSASSTVSGTGFSIYLASPPAIGGTVSAAGKFTNLQATSAITPSTTAGISGTTLADSANAGSVGEYATNSATGISAGNSSTANVVSLSLTAGDWDVSGVVDYVPAGSTQISSMTTGISSASASFGAVGTYVQHAYTGGVGIAQAEETPVVRINVSTTTTIYLVENVAFATSTCTMNGFIRARRIR